MNQSALHEVALCCQNYWHALLPNMLCNTRISTALSLLTCGLVNMLYFTRILLTTSHNKSQCYFFQFASISEVLSARFQTHEDENNMALRFHHCKRPLFKFNVKLFHNKSHLNKTEIQVREGKTSEFQLAGQWQSNHLSVTHLGPGTKDSKTLLWHSVWQWSPR